MRNAVTYNYAINQVQWTVKRMKCLLTVLLLATAFNVRNKSSDARMLGNALPTESMLPPSRNFSIGFHIDHRSRLHRQLAENMISSRKSRRRRLTQSSYEVHGDIEKDMIAEKELCPEAEVNKCGDIREEMRLYGNNRNYRTPVELYRQIQSTCSKASHYEACVDPHKSGCNRMVLRNIAEKQKRANNMLKKYCIGDCDSMKHNVISIIRQINSCVENHSTVKECSRTTRSCVKDVIGQSNCSLYQMLYRHMCAVGIETGNGETTMRAAWLDNISLIIPLLVFCM